MKDTVNPMKSKSKLIINAHPVFGVFDFIIASVFIIVGLLGFLYDGLKFYEAIMYLSLMLIPAILLSDEIAEGRKGLEKPTSVGYALIIGALMDLGVFATVSGPLRHVSIALIVVFTYSFSGLPVISRVEVELPKEKTRHLKEINTDDVISKINKVKGIHGGVIHDELTEIASIIDADDRNILKFPNTLNVVVEECLFLIDADIEENIDDIFVEFKEMIDRERSAYNKPTSDRVDEIRCLNKYVLETSEKK